MGNVFMDGAGAKFKLVLIEDMLYVEGIRKIIATREELCVFQIGREYLRVVGTGLKIREMAGREISLYGKVCGVSFVRELSECI